jgi:hypothetical protein
MRPAEAAGRARLATATKTTQLKNRKPKPALIAAAPELLAVAKLALNYLEGQEYLQACAIIAKATGGD